MSDKTIRERLRSAGKKTKHGLIETAIVCGRYAFWICYATCIIVETSHHFRCTPRRTKPKNYMPRPDPIPPQIPYPRRRRLTLQGARTQEEWQWGQRVCFQNQSPFFGKLPLEIRRMIYYRALGGQILHMSHSVSRLVAEYRPQLACSPEPLMKWFDVHQRSKFGMSIVHSCRRAYSEAIEFLYTGNMFTFYTLQEDLSTIDHLKYFLLPQRLALLRSVCFQWAIDGRPYRALSWGPDSDLSSWFRTWASISRLTGLRFLHVHVVIEHDPDWFYLDLFRVRKDELWAPIKYITWIKEFVVYVPSVRFERDMDVGGSGCVVKRPWWVETPPKRREWR